MRSPSLEKVQGHRRPNSHGFHGVIPKNRCHRRTGEAGEWHCWGITERMEKKARLLVSMAINGFSVGSHEQYEL